MKCKVVLLFIFYLERGRMMPEGQKDSLANSEGFAHNSSLVVLLDRFCCDSQPALR